MSIDSYYRQELQLLRDYAAQFGQRYPALAPLLSGPGSDPDVERLLEGVAFLTGNVQRRLDEQFPELLHPLLQMVAPHYLRPTPAATLIAFSPRANLSQTLTIPAGTYIDSVPVDGVRCRFRTSENIDVSPMRIHSAHLSELTRGGAIEGARLRVEFKLANLRLCDWSGQRLRLHLGGEFSSAADLYFLLNHYLRGLRLITEDGRIHPLVESSLSAAGFSDDSALMPYPGNVHPGFRLLQEYFQFPNKFLFLDLDLSGWKERGVTDSFILECDCKMPNFPLPRVERESLQLHVVPAVNLFNHPADPILVDHFHHAMPVEPAGDRPEAYTIFSVDKVTGLVRGHTEARHFECFTDRGGQTTSIPVYNTTFRRGMEPGQTETLLSVAYAPGHVLPDQEVLSISLTCSNGELPDALQLGDIHVAASNTPELVEYRNIVPTTLSHPPPLEGDHLWHLLSHLSANMLDIDSIDSLKDLLRLYLHPQTRDKAREVANRKRIEGLVKLEILPDERLIGAALARGVRIRIAARSDHFAGPGDLYLFGCVLDHYFASTAAINHYSLLEFDDQRLGEAISWPARLGDRRLV